MHNIASFTPQSWHFMARSTVRCEDLIWDPKSPTDRGLSIQLTQVQCFQDLEKHRSIYKYQSHNKCGMLHHPVAVSFHQLPWNFRHYLGIASWVGVGHSNWAFGFHKSLLLMSQHTQLFEKIWPSAQPGSREPMGNSTSNPHQPLDAWFQYSTTFSSC